MLPLAAERGVRRLPDVRRRHDAALPRLGRGVLVVRRVHVLLEREAAEPAAAQAAAAAAAAALPHAGALLLRAQPAVRVRRVHELRQPGLAVPRVGGALRAVRALPGRARLLPPPPAAAAHPHRVAAAAVAAAAPTAVAAAAAVAVAARWRGPAPPPRSTPARRGVEPEGGAAELAEWHADVAVAQWEGGVVLSLEFAQPVAVTEHTDVTLLPGAPETTHVELRLRPVVGVNEPRAFRLGLRGPYSDPWITCAGPLRIPPSPPPPPPTPRSHRPRRPSRRSRPAAAAAAVAVAAPAAAALAAAAAGPDAVRVVLSRRAHTGPKAEPTSKTAYISVAHWHEAAQLRVDYGVDAAVEAAWGATDLGGRRSSQTGAADGAHIFELWEAGSPMADGSMAFRFEVNRDAVYHTRPLISCEDWAPRPPPPAAPSPPPSPPPPPPSPPAAAAHVAEPAAARHRARPAAAALPVVTSGGRRPRLRDVFRLVRPGDGEAARLRLLLVRHLQLLPEPPVAAAVRHAVAVARVAAAAARIAAVVVEGRRGRVGKVVRRASSGAGWLGVEGGGARRVLAIKDWRELPRAGAVRRR